MAEPASRARPRRHEPGDVDARPVLVAACLLVAVLALVALAAFGTHALLRPDRGGSSSPSAAEVPAPRLQIAPASDLAALRRQKSAMLDEYRWVDPARGVVRIPIDRAMQLSVERSAAPSAAGVAR